LNKIAIELKELFKKAEISRSIYFSATSGHGILVDNTEKICKALGVDFNKYFNIKIDRHPYAKSESVGKRITLSLFVILLQLRESKKHLNHCLIKVLIISLVSKVLD